MELQHDRSAQALELIAKGANATISKVSTDSREMIAATMETLDRVNNNTSECTRVVVQAIDSVSPNKCLQMLKMIMSEMSEKTLPLEETIRETLREFKILLPIVSSALVEVMAAAENSGAHLASTKCTPNLRWQVSAASRQRT